MEDQTYRKERIMGVITTQRECSVISRMHVTVTVSGAADMPAMNSKRMFSPDKLTMDFDYDPETGGWMLNMWTVHGPIRVKSGELSERVNASRYGWGWTQTDTARSWVRDAINQYRPTGAVTVYPGIMVVQDH